MLLRPQITIRKDHKGHQDKRTLNPLSLWPLWSFRTVRIELGYMLSRLDPDSARSSKPKQLIANAYRQENLVSYRWCVALDTELAPLDDKINIGAGARLTFRIFTLANEVRPKRQLFCDPMEC